MLTGQFDWGRWLLKVAVVMGAVGLLGDASYGQQYFYTPQQIGMMQQGQAPVPPADGTPAAEVPMDEAAAGEEAAEEEEAEEEEETPWGLQKLFGWENGWIIGGYTQIGYQNNPDGAFTGNGIFLDDREWDRLTLNQQYMYIGKVADGKEGIGFGFRADLIYGVDGNEGQSFGNKPGNWDFLSGWDHGAYEWALPQLYGEVAYGDLSVKIGHFFTPIGYEVIPANGQFFLSRQLTFYNSEPFTHTGALATYKVSDKLSVNAGYLLGWDTGFDQLNNGSAGQYGFTYTISEKASLIFQGAAGNFGWRGDGSISSLIFSYNWTEKLQSVHQLDVLATNSGADFRVNGFAGDSVGFINYLFYQINDELKAGVRYEWYKADGVSYNTLTYGVNITPVKNIIIRPEIRHNWSPTNDTQYANSDGGTEDLFNQTIFGVDLIFVY